MNALGWINIALAVIAIGATTASGLLARQVRRLKEGSGDDVDPMSFLRRAQAVETQMVKVRNRAEAARRAGDVEGLEAALAEADLLVASVADIRLEQIACQERGWKTAP